MNPINSIPSKINLGEQPNDIRTLEKDVSLIGEGSGETLDNMVKIIGKGLTQGGQEKLELDLIIKRIYWSESLEPPMKYEAQAKKLLSDYMDALLSDDDRSETAGEQLIDIRDLDFEGQFTIIAAGLVQVVQEKLDRDLIIKPTHRSESSEPSVDYQAQIKKLLSGYIGVLPSDDDRSGTAGEQPNDKRNLERYYSLMGMGEGPVEKPDNKIKIVTDKGMLSEEEIERKRIRDFYRSESPEPPRDLVDEALTQLSSYYADILLPETNKDERFARVMGELKELMGEVLDRFAD